LRADDLTVFNSSLLVRNIEYNETYFLFLAFSLFFISCNETLTNEDAYSYTFKDKSALIISSEKTSYMKYGAVETGENLVFEYRYDKDDVERIADDGYSEYLQFEINSTLNEFSYANDEISNIDIVFSKACYCYFPFDALKDNLPTETISGNKISNTMWNIKIEMTFYGSDTRIVEENFNLQ
jgi:hypothetical protein